MEPVMEPVTKTSETSKLGRDSAQKTVADKEKRKDRKEKIEEILANLRLLERAEFPTGEMDVEHVKNLLANLYMEQIFPHNDKDTFMETNPGKKPSFFDKKI
jgi:hypothetical protein